MTFSFLLYKESKTLQCLNSDSNKIIFDQFIKKEDLLLTNEHINKPILENNKLVIGVHIQIYKGDAKCKLKLIFIELMELYYFLIFIITIIINIFII